MDQPRFRDPKVVVAPGLWLEGRSDSSAEIYGRDGNVTILGDGTINYCYFHTPQARTDLEALLADDEFMAKVRAQMAEWDITGRAMGLPMAFGMHNLPDEVAPGSKAHFEIGLGSNSDCPVEYPAGGPLYGFSVTTFGGEEVWRWTSGPREVGENAPLRLGYREERLFSVDWDLRDSSGRRLPEGAYWVTGYLNFASRPDEAPGPRSAGKRLFHIGPRLSLTHWLDFTLDVPEQARSGQPVPLKLIVTNTSSDPLQLFHGVAPADFTVLNSEGRQVWRWSNFKVFPDPLLNTTLRPGESRTYDAEWDGHDQNCQPPPNVVGRPCQGDPAPPARYRVVATFQAAPTDDYSEHRETVQVGPREIVVAP